MTKKHSPEAHARAIAVRLKKCYPDAHCALNFNTPLELLIATILSAQCTDVRVNQVTPAVFRKYPNAAAYAAADADELKNDIRSTGFFNAKAAAIQNCCRQLCERFGGEVPRELDALVSLPGVGRKTANVVLGTAFGLASGVVVDTHVARLSRRMGLTTHTQPEKIEEDLMRVFPQAEWIDLGHRLIEHGRRICSARKPLCAQCPINDLCPRIGVADGKPAGAKVGRNKSDRSTAVDTAAQSKRSSKTRGKSGASAGRERRGRNRAG